MRARTALPSSIVVVRGNWPGTDLERRLGAQVDDRLHAVPRRVRHRQSAAKSEKESESGNVESLLLHMSPFTNIIHSHSNVLLHMSQSRALQMIAQTLFILLFPSLNSNVITSR